MRQPFEHQSDKTKVEFSCGIDQRFLKVFDQTLTSFHPRIRSLNYPSGCYSNKSRVTLGCFFGFRRLGCQFKPNLGHHLRREFLHSTSDSVWVIAMIEQYGDVWDVDRLGSKVIQVIAQQFNQALVIGHIGRSAVGKKRQP